MTSTLVTGSLRIAAACLAAGLLSSGSCRVSYCNDCEDPEEEHRSVTRTTHVSVRLPADGRPAEILVVREPPENHVRVRTREKARDGRH